ncbi:MAG: hypothetical protein AAF628_23450 [Planctomycetota bacterium]
MVALLAVAPLASQESGPARTLPVDPVRLVQGDEVAGRRELSVARYGFTYRFASEATRRAFLAEPQRFEAQLGGACARMGPLSGIGSAEIYAVHAGRLYLFASDQCRDGFLRDPEALLLGADPVAVGDAAARARGVEWLARAAAAVGGEEALDRVLTLRRSHVRERVHGEDPYEYGDAWHVDFGGRAVRETWWAKVAAEDGWKRRDVLTPQGDFSVRGTDVAVELHPSQVTAIRQRLGRQPLVILKARGRDDFVAVACGEAAGVARVEVSFAGATTTVGIDAASGRIVSACFRGRGPSQRLGEVVRTFHDFEDFGSLELATRYEVTFDGASVPDAAVTSTETELGQPLDDALFRR